MFFLVICFFLKEKQRQIQIQISIWHAYIMLHRQKTYDMYIQFYIDKRHMTCIYNLHRQKTYDMYIQFTQTKDIWHVYTILHIKKKFKRR